MLSKYQRYDNDKDAVAMLRDAAVDEVTDVTVILEHVKSIFKVSDTDIRNQSELKADRLERWMDSSSSLEHTTKDRELIKTDISDFPKGRAFIDNDHCGHGFNFWDCPVCGSKPDNKPIQPDLYTRGEDERLQEQEDFR